MNPQTLPRPWSAADSATASWHKFIGACHVIARNRLALLGFMLVGIWLVTALAAPLIATQDPYEINIAQRLDNPSKAHWLGTDYLGRDTFSRIVFGARTALQVALGAVFLGAFLGIPIGAIAGFSGRWVDSALMRLMDAIIAFPGRLLAIALVASLGGGLYSLYIALGVNAIPSYARIVRGVVLSQKQKEYVEAARMTGEGGRSGATSVRFPRFQRLFPGDRQRQRSTPSRPASCAARWRRSASRSRRTSGAARRRPSSTSRTSATRA